MRHSSNFYLGTNLSEAGAQLMLLCDACCWVQRDPAGGEAAAGAGPPEAAAQPLLVPRLPRREAQLPGSRQVRANRIRRVHPKTS